MAVIEGRTLVSMFGEDCILTELAGAAPNSSKLRTRKKIRSQRQPLHPPGTRKGREEQGAVVVDACALGSRGGKLNVDSIVEAKGGGQSNPRAVSSQGSLIVTTTTYGVLLLSLELCTLQIYVLQQILRSGKFINMIARSC